MTTEAGDDDRKVLVQVIDGDGTLVFESAPLGIDFVSNPPFGTSHQTYDPLVTALPDGGFAVVWHERSPSEVSSRQGQTDTYLQMFDADGTAREAATVIVDRTANDFTLDADLRALPDGRLVYSVATQGYDYFQYLVDTDGTIAATQGYSPDFLVERDDHGVAAYDGGYVMFFVDRSGTSDGATQRTVEMRFHTVDPDTGAITATNPPGVTGPEIENATLATLAPGERISEVAYAALNTDAVAAAIRTDSGRIVLATYVDGAAQVQDVAAPFGGQHVNTGVSLLAAPGGGAYLSMELVTHNSVEGRIYSGDAFAAFVDTDGQLGTFESVSDRVGNAIGNNYNPIVAATDDGLFATWRDGADVVGISYQDADGYNTITGTAAADTLGGTAADDHVRAGAGDDTLLQSAGIDRFDGGAGFDTFQLDPTRGAYASLQEARTGALDGTGPVEALLNIEALTGTAFADLLGDDAGANRIAAGGGDDTILGYGGADTILGGAGTDTFRTASDEQNAYFTELRLGTGTEVEVLDITTRRLEGTAGDDAFDLSGIQSYDTFAETWLGDGGDIYTGTQTADNARGERGDDRLAGAGGDDTLDGGSGNDTIIGGTGDDRLTGGTSFSSGNTFVLRPGDGNDTITDFQWSRDILDLSAYSDAALAAISVSLTPEGDRFVDFGGGDTLTLIGVPRNHTPFGSIGVTGDAVQGGTLSLDFSGLTDYDGFDPDTATVQWLRGGAPIAGATGPTYSPTQDDVGQRLTAQVSYVDTFRTREERETSRSATIANVNDPVSGAVTITGAATQGGTLTAVTDALSDPDGLGAFRYQWLADGVAIDGATGDSLTLTDDAVGTAISVEVSFTDGGRTEESVRSAATGAVTAPGLALTGTDAAEFIGGSGAADTLSGLGGADTLSGGAGHDSALGGDGDDLIFMGLGDDILFGEGGNDTLYGAAGNDTLDGGAGDDLLGAGAGDDVLDGGDGADALWTSAGNDQAEGGVGDDTLGGALGNDTLSGGAGADDLWGAIGDDSLSGGDGDDLIGGAVGNDTIDGGAGVDEIWGSLGDDSLSGGADADQIGAGLDDDFVDGGTGDDLVFGGLGDDTLQGGDGNDTLYGAAGADAVTGGAGDDLIFVGTGADVVRFGAADGADEVRFFSVAEDRLVLDDALWTGTLDAAQIVSQFGSRADGDYVLTFDGGESLTLINRAGAADAGIEALIDIV